MKNKNTSPLFALGQGITNYEDYKALAFVGAPVDFTGQAIVQLGALISQEDANKFAEINAADEKKEPIRDIFAEELKEGKVKLPDFKPAEIKVNPINPGSAKTLLPLNNEDKNKVGGGVLPDYKTAYNNMSSTAQATYTKLGKAQGISGMQFYTNQQEGMSKEQKAAREKVRLWASKNLNKGEEFNVNNPVHVAAWKKDPNFDPLSLMGKGEENNPDLNTDTDPDPNKNKGSKKFSTLDYLGLRGMVENVGNFFNTQNDNNNTFTLEDAPQTTYTIDSSNKRLKPEILKIIKNSVYDKKGEKDTRFQRVAHVLTSPFHKTDNVSYKYLRRAVMPKYAQQGLGSAAAEGYNLRVDAMNYNRAVKASFDSDLEKEIGSLDVPAPSDYSTSNQRNDLLQIGLDSKKQLADAFNSYAIKGDISKLEYEQLKDRLQARIGNISASIKVFNGASKTYIENKDKIDPDASDTKMMDFYETLEKAPESIGIKQIDGADYFVGKTIGGQDFKVSVSQVANGNAKFQLTEKADAGKIATDVLKDMLAQKSEVRTAQGFGLAQYTDDSTEDETSFIRNLAENKLVQMFNTNPDTARSLATQVSNMDFNAYQNAIGRDINGDGIVDNSEIKENEKLLYKDLASEFYNLFIKDVYNPQTFTTARTTGSKSGVRSSQKERERAQFIASWNQFPMPNKNNISSYNKYLSNNNLNIVKDDKGNYGVINIKTGKSVPGSKFDFENKSPAQIKEQILGYTGFLTFDNNVASNRSREDVFNQYIVSKK